MRSNLPASIPNQLKFSAASTFRWANKATRVALTLRHQGPAYEDDLNIDRLPAATTLDVVVSQRISRQATVKLRIENAFDERTVTRNQAGSIDLGAPRILWLALDIGD